jgi:BMFP domain-containing protein YqiC
MRKTETDKIAALQARIEQLENNGTQARKALAVMRGRLTKGAKRVEALEAQLRQVRPFLSTLADPTIAKALGEMPALTVALHNFLDSVEVVDAPPIREEDLISFG